MSGIGAYQYTTSGNRRELKLLLTNKRIGRHEYFFYSIVIPVLFFWVIAAFAGFFGKMGDTGSIIAYLLLALAIISALIIFVQLTIQRCHDFNASGWLSILILIPFASLLFWLMPGSEEPNKYGNAPKQASTLLKTGVLVLVATFVAGITYVSLNFLGLGFAL